MNHEKCFACGKILKPFRRHLVDTRDGQEVFVGIDCYKKIKKAGVDGFQPEKGGPRLWLLASELH